MMTAINPTPLKGIVLAGCAKANANSGLTSAAKKCGYGSDIERFVESLQSVCTEMDIRSTELSELMAEKSQIREVQPAQLGLEILER
ncbi:MAG: hypothetical protein ACFB2W_24655 [Leptolyngbyaceae cyanobacterium]